MFSIHGFKAFLTDLDGTLIDSVTCILKALHKAFLEIEQDPPDESSLLAMFGLPVELMLTELTEVKEEDTEAIRFFVNSYKKWYQIFLEETRLIPGARETLCLLKELGCPTALITSERRSNVGHMLSQVGLEGLFTEIITRDDVVDYKPNPEPLLKAAEALGMLCSDCVYLGESPFDIKAGKAAEIFTIAVPSGPWSKESLLSCKPDLFVDSIFQLKQHINYKR